MGRLFPPRTLGRELDELLRKHLQAATAVARAMPSATGLKAQLHIAAAKGWMKRMRREHLTPHHLRVPRTESLHCWLLPACVHAQLVRQLSAPLHALPCAQRLSVRVLAPITGRMRLCDRVSAHLRAPYHSNGNKQPWWGCADERVQVHWGAGSLLVCVE